MELAVKEGDVLAINGGKKAKSTPYGQGSRFGAEELQQLEEALRQNTLFYYKGTKVKAFTEKFAKMHGSKFCTATSSGSASIHVALSALGVSVGDEVIVSPLTDMGSVIGILFQNAIPVFADIHPYHYSMTVESVEKNITSRTKAIVAVHLMGSPCDMDGLMALSEKYGIPIIEDCAQSFGTRYRDTLVGRFGAIGCFSTNDFKHISTGDGGLVVTQDEGLAALTAAIADKNYRRTGKGIGGSPDFLAPNYRMTELQGAVGIAQLDKLNWICERRHTLGMRLCEALRTVAGVVPFEVPEAGYATFFHFAGRFQPEAFRCDRATWLRALQEEGVPVGPYIAEPLYQYNLFKNRNIYQGSFFPFEGTGKSYVYEKGMCPVAEEVIATMFVHSFSEFYTEQDIDETAAAFKKVSRAYLR